MGVPHHIPFQGSKRNLAPAILGYFAERVGTLIEPFAGSAALTLAAPAGFGRLRQRPAAARHQVEEARRACARGVRREPDPLQA